MTGEDKIAELQADLRAQIRTCSELSDRLLLAIVGLEGAIQDLAIVANAICRHEVNKTLKEIVEAERARLLANPSLSVFSSVEASGVQE